MKVLDYILIVLCIAFLVADYYAGSPEVRVLSLVRIGLNLFNNCRNKGRDEDEKQRPIKELQYG
jgi:hypothetical protein